MKNLPITDINFKSIQNCQTFICTSPSPIPIPILPTYRFKQSNSEVGSYVPGLFVKPVKIKTNTY